MMANRLTRRNKAMLAGDLHPHYREVDGDPCALCRLQSAVERRPDPTAEDDLAALIDGETSCVVVQNPGFFGHVRDFSALAEACHAPARCWSSS